MGLLNAEFGEKITHEGVEYLVVKNHEDGLREVVEVGVGFPAPILMIQLKEDD